GKTRNIIDWTRPHTVQEYVDGLCLKRAHAKALRRFLHDAPCQRRGRGRNKPLEYTGGTGIRLFEHAMTDWTSDSDERENAMLQFVTSQVRKPTAPSPEGLAFRAMFVRLMQKFPLRRTEAMAPDLMSYVKTEENWLKMH